MITEKPTYYFHPIKKKGVVVDWHRCSYSPSGIGMYKYFCTEKNCRKVLTMHSIAISNKESLTAITN